MRKVYTILCGLALSILMLVGLISTFDFDATYSESERRKLKTTPLMTFSALLDGSFFSDYAAYFADTFPGRELLMADNRTLNGFYYFGGLSDEDDASLILDFNSNGASQGEALQDDKPTETGPVETEPEPAAEQLGSVLLVGHRAFDVPTANRERIVRYAAAVNAIADTLGSEIRTYSMPVPNSAEFYTPEAFHSGSNSQADMFRLCRENLDSSVTYVDALSVLAAHTDEYLYFRTDHHWTHLGAYYAYTAFCEAAGLTPCDPATLQTGQWEDFVGSMYTYASNYPQAQILKENPDTVQYWKPVVAHSCHYYSDTTLSDPYPIGVISTVGDNVSNKYLTFMGGDHPVTVVETEAEGPCILVIKESYGNAFASWLTGHYSRIILIDPREYFAGNSDIDLADFAREQGVQECLIINYPMMLNSAGYIAHLENLTK
ncbi:MAG: hypothetical protein IJZ39_02740 [Oscillospiraceae bacterium]|nr:hypothetical protein [Oscillospiraceae bacterium]